MIPLHHPLRDATVAGGARRIDAAFLLGVADSNRRSRRRPTVLLHKTVHHIHGAIFQSADRWRAAPRATSSDACGSAASDPNSAPYGARRTGESAPDSTEPTIAAAAPTDPGEFDRKRIRVRDGNA